MDFNELIEDLKLGKQKTKIVSVEYDNKLYDITIRQLSNAELQEIKEITTKPIKLVGAFDTSTAGSSQIHLERMSAADLTKSSYEAMITAISFSVTVNGVKFSKEDVDDLFTMKIIENLYNEIQEFNGLDNIEIKEDKVIEVENFREN